MFDATWQRTALSKTAEGVSEFFPVCDEQVIASALGQLRIIFTCIFKVFQIDLVAWRLG